MTVHLMALATTLAMYLGLGVSCLGWGILVARLIGGPGSIRGSTTATIWLGWAGVLFVLQLVHLFLPLNAWGAIPVFLAGMALALPWLRRTFTLDALRYAVGGWKTGPVWGAAVLTAVAVAAWIASRAMLPPTIYDTGLYHLNTIRWINEYPIVPGLGLLHGRLAFNQSFFVWTAASNVYPFFGHGRTVANSFLMLLAMATCVQWSWPALRRPSRLLNTHPFRYVAPLFALPYLVYLAIFSQGVASPSPDLTSTLLQAVLLIWFARFLLDAIDEGRSDGGTAAMLPALAATAVTVKLSNLAFAAMLYAIWAAILWRKVGLRRLVRWSLPAIAVLLLWAVRGYVTSGMPLYPATIGYVPFEWAVPRGSAEVLVSWIRSWARMPYARPQDVLGNWDWLRPWLRNLLRDRYGVVYPAMACALLSLAAVLLTWARQGGRGRLGWAWLTVVPPASGLFYWFASAPDPRFAEGLLWGLMLGCGIVLLAAARGLTRKGVYAVLLCGVLLATNASYLTIVARQRYRLKAISTSGWHAVRIVPMKVETTRSGLEVFMPVEGDQSWDAPLPCTPYLEPSLRLRKPGRMASGFTVLPARSEEDIKAGDT